MKVQRRSGVSVIIATLLLIAISVAAGIIVYVFVNGLAGSLTGSGGQQVTQQLQLQTYSDLPASTAGGFTSYGTIGNGQLLDAFIKNTGSSSIVISAVYFDGNILTEWGTAQAYDYNLEVPSTVGNCYALVPVSGTGSTITGATSDASHVAGTANSCAGLGGASCASAVCLNFGASAPAETGGTTATALAPGSSTQLIIGLNAAYSPFPAQGSGHTIKVVTTTGGVAVLSIVVGRTG